MIGPSDSGVSESESAGNSADSSVFKPAGMSPMKSSRLESVEIG